MKKIQSCLMIVLLTLGLTFPSISSARVSEEAPDTSGTEN